MAVVTVMSAVAINAAADVFTADVFEMKVRESRYWIVAMTAMMALMLCISLGSQGAGGAESPSQTFPTFNPKSSG